MITIVYENYIRKKRIFFVHKFMCSVIKIQNVSFGKANSNKIDILIFNTIQGVSTTYNFPYNVLKSQPLTVTKRITEFKLTFLLLSTDFQSC